MNIKLNKQAMANKDKLYEACKLAKLSAVEAALLLGNAYIETGFTQLREDLAYSYLGLMKTWPSIFKRNPQLARDIAFQPRVIANKVYANKLGNGGPETNDGWIYRGLGYLQITGKHTYSNVYRMYSLLYANKLIANPPPLSDRLLSAAKDSEATAIAYWCAYVRKQWQQPVVDNIEHTSLLEYCCKAINKAGLKLEERLACTKYFYEEIKALNTHR